MRNARLKLAKNQAKSKQLPEAELLLVEKYSLSSSRLSSKANLRYSKKGAKNKCVCFNLLTTNVPIYRNQSVDLLCKSTYCFLYDRNIGR